MVLGEVGKQAEPLMLTCWIPFKAGFEFPLTYTQGATLQNGLQSTVGAQLIVAFGQLELVQLELKIVMLPVVPIVKRAADGEPGCAVCR